MDGRDYADLAWLAGVNVGYRLDVVSSALFGAYLLPQAGYLVGIYTNIGPRKSPDRFVTAEFNVGLSF